MCICSKRMDGRREGERGRQRAKEKEGSGQTGRAGGTMVTGRPLY